MDIIIYINRDIIQEIAKWTLNGASALCRTCHDLVPYNIYIKQVIISSSPEIKRWKWGDSLIKAVLVGLMEPIMIILDSYNLDSTQIILARCHIIKANNIELLETFITHFGTQQGDLYKAVVYGYKTMARLLYDYCVDVKHEFLLPFETIQYVMSHPNIRVRMQLADQYKIGKL